MSSSSIPAANTASLSRQQQHQHSEENLPHWLVENCQRLYNDDIEFLNLNIRRLNKPYMSLISNSLSDAFEHNNGNKKLKTINLVSSIVEKYAEIILYKILPKTNIEVVHLCYNKINDVSLLEFGMVLKEPLQYLASSLPVYSLSLKQIYLGYNDITSVGVQALVEGLHIHKTIEVVELNNNKIDDAGLAAFTSLLTTNNVLLSNQQSKLRKINLSHNSITENGAKSFLHEVLIDSNNVTLKELSLGNNSISSTTMGLIKYYTDTNLAGRYYLLCQQHKSKSNICSRSAIGNITVTMKHGDTKKRKRNEEEDIISSRASSCIEKEEQQRQRQQQTNDAKNTNSINEIQDIWPYVLAFSSTKPDMLYYFLTSKPDLCKNTP